MSSCRYQKGTPGRFILQASKLQNLILGGEIRSGGTEEHDQHCGGEHREWQRGLRNEPEGMLTVRTLEEEESFTSSPSKYLLRAACQVL